MLCNDLILLFNLGRLGLVVVEHCLAVDGCGQLGTVMLPACVLQLLAGAAAAVEGLVALDSQAALACFMSC